MVTILSSPIVTQALGLYATAASAMSGSEPKATATLNAPVVTRNERRESASVLVSFNMIPASLTYALNSGDDLRICSAAADIAVHVLDNLLARWLRSLRQ